MTTSGQRFGGMVALVTGAASGIGAAIARRLVDEGAFVVGGDVNDELLSRVSTELGPHFVGSRCDITDEQDVAALVKLATETFGPLEIAFNVAGGVRSGTLLEGNNSDWDFTIALVLRGTYLSTRFEAAAMTAGGGAIVNVSSLNAHVPLYGGSSYAVAKSGVEMLTKSAALELARFGIRVNAVLPGLTETPLTAAMLSRPDVEAAYLERISLARAAAPEEIAGPCLYLASRDASYITGTSLVVDGGWEITGYPDLSKFMN